MFPLRRSERAVQAGSQEAVSITAGSFPLARWLAGALTTLALVPAVAASHVPGCHSRKCDRRVHDRRARHWCRTHVQCIWRHRFHALPANWQTWAWNTARCESGLRFYIATGNGYYGGMQFTAPTAQAAGFDRLPHLTTKWEQLTRAVWWAQRQGVAQWPVCGV